MNIVTITQNSQKFISAKYIPTRSIFFFLGFSAIVFQAVCDHKYLFTACYVGWSESVHDGQVFSNSDLNMQISEDMFSFFLENLFICSNSFQG